MTSLRVRIPFALLVALAFTLPLLASEKAAPKKKECCSYRQVACKTKPVRSNLGKCGVGITSDPNHVRFAVVGDYGKGNYRCEKCVADQVKGWDKAERLDFVMTLGDNNYEDGAADTIDTNITRDYGDFIRQRRFYPSLGNHDWYTVRTGPPYPYWGYPYPYVEYFSYLAALSPQSDPPVQGRYYMASPSPLLDIFALDSDYHENDGTCCNSKQAGWLRQSLAASEKPWKVVFFHHAPYTTAREDPASLWMRWPFREWCATSVLAGHEHAYERLDIGGIPYFVNGIGGNPWLYEQEACPIAEGSKKRFNRAHGAMLVVANSKEMEFCLYAVDAADPVDVYRQQVPPRCTPSSSECVPPPDLAKYCNQQPPVEEPNEDCPGPIGDPSARQISSSSQGASPPTLRE